jgi:hypothetical protein
MSHLQVFLTGTCDGCWSRWDASLNASEPTYSSRGHTNLADWDGLRFAVQIIACRTKDGSLHYAVSIIWFLVIQSRYILVSVLMWYSFLAKIRTLAIYFPKFNIQLSLYVRFVACCLCIALYNFTANSTYFIRIFCTTRFSPKESCSGATNYVCTVKSVVHQL